MNVAVTRAADGLPRRAFTVQDIRRIIDADVIGEDERIELIQGDVVVMPPKRFAHELVRVALTRSIFLAASDDLFVGAATMLQLADDVLVDADLAVVQRADYKPSKSGFAQPTVGAVLLVVEIADDGLGYDRDVKARLYARCGIREFWVIDANDRVTWIHTNPSGEGWGSIIERGPNETLTTPALLKLAIRLSDID